MPDTPGHWAIPLPPAAAGIPPRRGTPRPSPRSFGSPTAPRGPRPASSKSPAPKVLRISRKNSLFQQYHCLWLIKALTHKRTVRYFWPVPRLVGFLGRCRVLQTDAAVSNMEIAVLIDADHYPALAFVSTLQGSTPPRADRFHAFVFGVQCKPSGAVCRASFRASW